MLCASSSRSVCKESVTSTLSAILVLPTVNGVIDFCACGVLPLRKLFFMYTTMVVARLTFKFHLTYSIIDHPNANNMNAQLELSWMSTYSIGGSAQLCFKKKNSFPLLLIISHTIISILWSVNILRGPTSWSIITLWGPCISGLLVMFFWPKVTCTLRSALSAFAHLGVSLNNLFHCNSVV